MTHIFGKGGVGGFLGRSLSLKNLVPEALTVGGSLVGGPIGAGLGRTAGGLIEGQKFGQSALGGLEAGAGDYALSGLGGTVGNALQGTMAGNALDTVGSDLSGLGSSLGLTGPGGLTSEISGLGSSLGLTGPGGLTSDIMGGLSSVGSDLGITGPGGLTSDVSNLWKGVTGPAATQALKSGAVSNPAIAQALSQTGEVASTAPGASILPAGSGTGTILGNLFGGGGDGKGLFGGSPALGLLAAAPVALQAIRGSQPFKGETQLQQSAAQLGQQGKELQNYLQTGTLPPGAQAAINQATASAQAAIRSQYASMGMIGSSAEAQDLAAAQQAGVTQATNMAAQLLSTGVQDTQMSDQLYQDIMNQSMQDDQNLSAAIGNFAYMAGGGLGGTGGKNGSVNVSL